MNFSPVRLPNKTSLSLSLTLLAFFLGACQVTHPSNQPLTSSASEAKVSQVVRLSYEMSTQLQKAKGQLRAIEVVLGGISNAVAAQSAQDAEPGSRPKGVILILRQLLGQAVEGMVEVRDDSSWFLEREFPEGLPIDQASDCPPSHFRVEGGLPQYPGLITLSALNCKISYPLVLATIQADAEATILTTLPENMDRLMGRTDGPPDHSPQCTTRIFASRTEMTCDPFTLQGRSGSPGIQLSQYRYSTADDGLDFLSVDNRTDVEIQALIISPQKQPQTAISFVKHPGSKISLHVDPWVNPPAGGTTP